MIKDSCYKIVCNTMVMVYYVSLTECYDYGISTNGVGEKKK